MVDPEGIIIDHFLSRGYINYEHQQGEQFKIGVPTKNSYVDRNIGLYVEAKLYKKNPYAKGMWDLANNIAKSGIDRSLGFSVEGEVHERDKADPRIIRKALITNVALTTSPANPNTSWETFMKSFLTGYSIDSVDQEGAASLRIESLARSLHNLSYAYKDFSNTEDFAKVWKGIGEYLDSIERYTPETAVMFLQLFKGYSRMEAIEKIDKYMNKDYLERGKGNE